MLLQKRNRKNPCCDGIVLYLDCISVNVLVILYYNFKDVITGGGNWVKGSWDPSVLYFQLHLKLQLCLIIKSIYIDIYFTFTTGDNFIGFGEAIPRMA